MLVGQRGECKWIKGFEVFLKSSLTKNVFRHFRPEEKELFVAETIIEPIFQAQKGNKQISKTLASVFKAVPYVGYSCLRYPDLFQEFGMLDKALGNVT